MKVYVKFVPPPEPAKKEIAQLKCQERCMKTALIIVTALLSGCMTPTTATTEQNFYETTYRSNTVGATKEQIAAAFYPSAKDPQIIRTNLRDANSAFQSLKTQGYQPIGISQFTTWIVQKDSDLIHAAKKVDADLVVTLAYFAGRKVVQFPFQTMTSPGGFSNNSATVTSSGTFSGDVNGTYSGTENITVPPTYTSPQYSTQWVPTPLDYDTYETVFFRRQTGRPFHYTSDDHKI